MHACITRGVYSQTSLLQVLRDVETAAQRKPAAVLVHTEGTPAIGNGLTIVNLLKTQEGLQNIPYVVQTPHSSASVKVTNYGCATAGQQNVNAIKQYLMQQLNLTSQASTQGANR